MAPSADHAPDPGRTLLVLLALMVAMTSLMFLQGPPVPKLGLDLAGGTTVTLTAVTEAGKNPPDAQMNQALEIMRDRVNGLGVSDAEVSKQGGNVIVVNVPGEGQDRVVQLIGTTAQLQFRQVYALSDATPDLTGGLAPTASPSATAKPTATPTPGATATAAPRGRAVPPALTAPTPTPGATGSPRPPAPTAPVNPLPTETFEGVEDRAVIAQYQQLTCTKGKRVPGADDPRKKWVVGCSEKADSESGAYTKYILGPVQVQGQQVSDAVPQPPNAQQGQNSWSVSLQFKSQGARQFAAVTTKAYQAYQANPGSSQQYVAIVLDGQVISAPSITNGAITGGQASIYGPPQSFTQQYATDLSNVLKYGALPLKFTPSSIDEVSSTLGDDQLRGGLIAGGIGLGLVVVYSLVYYRGLGLVSVLSLLVAAALTYLSVVILGANIGFRLSLPHIIGLIVSIGITADSFIVYFERLRDELRAGRALRPSVEVAWRRARRTILVADAVTFIAALVLFFLAVGGVAGFAFAMGLTTLIDIVVVFMFTKPLVALLMRTRFFAKGHKLSGLDVQGLRRDAAARTMRQEA